eukprot:jgi/Mesvir1/19956/Mv13215-RA.1
MEIGEGEPASYESLPPELIKKIVEKSWPFGDGINKATQKAYEEVKREKLEEEYLKRRNAVEASRTVEPCRAPRQSGSVEFGAEVVAAEDAHILSLLLVLDRQFPKNGDHRRRFASEVAAGLRISGPFELRPSFLAGRVQPRSRSSSANRFRASTSSH